MAWHGVPYPGQINTTSLNLNSSGTNFNFNTLTTQNFTITNGPPAAIQINAPTTGEPVLKIHNDGKIEYTGKPSVAAEAFLKAFGSNIDINAAGKLALEKTYRRAIERCLTQAKSMSHDDFIAMLENELDTRKSKAVLMRLQEPTESDNI
jgi:hypothetical protein